MSRVKTSNTHTVPDKKRRNEWPAVVYFWVFGLAIFGYLIGRIGLNSFPHPYHWLSGLIGGVAGVPIGWLWYRWRGDVF